MPTQQQTVTHDAVDDLVTKLNTISGIEFARDAWLEKAPDNYGVVELSGEAGQLWADGHLTDSVWRVSITLYVTGDDDTWKNTVEAKLRALEDEGVIDMTHIVTRDFDYQIGKVRWVWTVNMFADLVTVETVVGTT